VKGLDSIGCGLAVLRMIGGWRGGRRKERVSRTRRRNQSNERETRKKGEKREERDRTYRHHTRISLLLDSTRHSCPDIVERRGRVVPTDGEERGIPASHGGRFFESHEEGVHPDCVIQIEKRELAQTLGSRL